MSFEPACFHRKTECSNILLNYESCTYRVKRESRRKHASSTPKDPEKDSGMPAKRLGKVSLSRRTQFAPWKQFLLFCDMITLWKYRYFFLSEMYLISRDGKKYLIPNFRCAVLGDRVNECINAFTPSTQFLSYK